MANVAETTKAMLITDKEFTAKEIAEMTQEELFDAVLAYEGFGRCGGSEVRHWAQLIYGTDILPIDKSRQQ